MHIGLYSRTARRDINAVRERLAREGRGYSPAEVRRLRETLMRIRDRGIAVLLVEHNMRFVLTTADHVVVLLPDGPVEGTPAALRASTDPRIVAVGSFVAHSFRTDAPVFLASAASRFVTGHVLACDGGMEVW